MFTKEDYKDYFEELEDIFKKSIVIYTDLLNLLEDQATRNKLYMLASENMDGFRFAKAQKERFI